PSKPPASRHATAGHRTARKSPSTSATRRPTLTVPPTTQTPLTKPVPCADVVAPAVTAFAAATAASAAARRTAAAATVRSFHCSGNAELTCGVESLPGHTAGWAGVWACPDCRARRHRGPRDDPGPTL